MSRNIVLVTVDSLRADCCGFINSESSLTPTLDSMALGGVSFTNAVSPGPRTPSAMPTILTGTTAQTIAAEPHEWQRRRQHIRDHMDRYRTIAERLSARGYTTVGLTVNPWTQDTGFDAGFDQFIEVDSGLRSIESSRTTAFSAIDTVMDRTALGEQVNWGNKRDWFVRWTDFYDRIQETINTATEPYFLWVFLLDTHQPYIAPRQFRRDLSAAEMYYTVYEEWKQDDGTRSPAAHRRLQKAYADTVRSVDSFAEQLLSDLGEETAVVLHSDHGEAFGEHGSYGHEQALYQENLRVPLVVANAGTDRIDDPVSLGAIPAMIETIAADDDRFDPTDYIADSVVSRTETGDKWAVYDGRLKYLISADGSQSELYDTATDPDEQQNLLETGESAAPFEQLLGTHRRHQLEKQLIATGVDRLGESSP